MSCGGLVILKSAMQQHSKNWSTTFLQPTKKLNHNSLVGCSLEIPILRSWKFCCKDKSCCIINCYLVDRPPEYHSSFVCQEASPINSSEHGYNPHQELFGANKPFICSWKDTFKCSQAKEIPRWIPRLYCYRFYCSRNASIFFVQSPRTTSGLEADCVSFSPT